MALPGINNLHGLNTLTSSTPAAPTITSVCNKSYIDFFCAVFVSPLRQEVTKNRVVTRLHPPQGRLPEEVGSVWETISVPELDSGNFE